MAEITVRPMEARDVEKVVEFSGADYCEQKFWLTGIDWCYISSRNSTEAILAGNIPGDILIAVDGSEAVMGAVVAVYSPFFSNHYRPVCYLEGWYVDPAHRNKGVGKALLQVIEWIAKWRGACSIGRGIMLQNENREWLMDKTVAEGYLPAQTMAFKPLGG